VNLDRVVAFDLGSWFGKADTGAATVFWDELYTSFLKSRSDDVDGRLSKPLAAL
jgi:hypothetical protein